MSGHKTISRPLRILHFSDLLFEEVPGGSRQVARELLRAQRQIGHDTTLLVGSHRAGEAKEWHDPVYGHVVTYDRGDSPTAYLRNGRQACERLIREASSEKRPFDVVHTHFAYAATGPLQAIDGTIPRVRSFYGPWDGEGWIEEIGDARSAPLWKRPALTLKAVVKRPFRHRIEKENLRASAATVILSEQSRGEVRAFGFPDDRIFTFAGGVNRERFTVDSSDPQARPLARARIGLAADAFPLLLSIRRLVSRMGLENLIAAMPAVCRQFPRAKLIIGGTGPMRKVLEEQVATLGLSAAVTFAGFIPDGQIADYYRAADLFVLPTVALEGFGLVIVEALACGTPVVATPIGAIPEVLGGLDRRLLTRGIDPESISQALIEFSRARNESNSWAAQLTAAKLTAFVDERYSWTVHAHAIESLYRRILLPVPE